MYELNKIMVSFSINFAFTHRHYFLALLNLQYISPITSQCTYNFPDYVEEMYKLLMSLTLGELAQEAEHLKNITPTPMNTMLERQPREEAILKAQSRKSMVVVDIPATGKGTELSQ